jgi:hypothetical protein
MQERSPEIVVLYVQTFPATGRHLIDKAEDTPVMTPGYAEQRELNPEAVVRILLNKDLSGCSLLRMQRNNDPFFSDQKTVIDNVMDFFPVQRVNHVPRSQAQFFSGAARLDMYDFEQSGSLLGSEHEVNVPDYLHHRLIGNLTQFPHQHDLVDTKDFFEVTGLFFGQRIFSLPPPELRLRWGKEKSFYLVRDLFLVCRKNEHGLVQTQFVRNHDERRVLRYMPFIDRYPQQLGADAEHLRGVLKVFKAFLFKCLSDHIRYLHLHPPGKINNTCR